MDVQLGRVLHSACRAMSRRGAVAWRFVADKVVDEKKKRKERENAEESEVEAGVIVGIREPDRGMVAVLLLSIGV